MVDLLQDADEEGGEVLLLGHRELGPAAETKAVREKAVHNMKVGATHLREDGGVVREERKNRATQVAIERTTQCVLIRTLVRGEREEGRKGGRERLHVYLCNIILQWSTLCRTLSHKN